MNKRKLIPLTDPSQIPAPMGEAEAQAFWDTHEVTEAFLAKTPTVDDDLPLRTPVSSQSITVRLETDTLTRLKSLAAQRQMGYQTLLKNFLLERLYEEERRSGASVHPRGRGDRDGGRD